EKSPQSTSYYYNVFQSLKNFKPNAVTASGMVQTQLDQSTGCNYGYPEQKRYEDIINKFGGYVGRSCPTDWDSQMRALEAATFGAHNCFALNNLPEADATSGVVDQTTILVKLNGNSFPDVGGKGQRNWDYDSTKNAICFYPLSMPEAGTEINISYHVACL